MPENNQILSVEGQLIGIPLQEYTAGDGISIDAVNKVVTNIGIPLIEGEATRCGTFKGDAMYTKNYTFTGTVNAAETTINMSISEKTGTNGVNRIWVDPSNSYVKYGPSNTIYLPIAWRLGANREGSVSVINSSAGSLTCRCVDTGATALTFYITIRYTVGA